MRPWLALGIVAVLTVVLAAGMPRIDAQVDFVDTVPEHPGLAPYRDMLERLDGVRFVAIYMAHDPASGPDLRQPEGFDALVTEQQDLTGFLETRFPGAFSHTLSVYEGMKAGNYMLEKIATGGNARAGSYSIPEDPVRYQTVRDRGLEDGSFDDVLADDGSSAILLAFFATKDNDEARALSGQVADTLPAWDGAQVTRDHQASGLLYSSHVTDERNRSDVVFWGGIAMAAVAVALVVVLGRIGNAIIALASVGLATVWTFGTLGWLGVPLSFLSVFLAPLIIGVGIDHSVHVLHRIEEDGDVATGLRAMRRPVTVAALTTAAGLAMLLLVPAPLFAEIGGIAALGILWSLAAALLFTPAARAVFGVRKRRHARFGLSRLAAWTRRSPVTIIIVVAVTLIAAAAATQTRLESGSAENEFPQDDPVIQLQHRIEEEYGAFQRAYIIVRGDMTDPAALALLLDATGAAQELPLYREASSVADLLLADAATDEGAIDIARDGLLGGAGQAPSDQDRLPQNQADARAALDALFEDPLWRTIAPFTITRDYDLAVVAITLDPWSSQEELRGLRDAMLDLEGSLQDRIPHEVRAGGAPMNRAAIIEQTWTDVGIATIGTAVAVGGILAIAWRKRGRDGIRVAALGVGMTLLAALWILGAIPVLDGIYGLTGGNNAALNDMFLLAFAVTVAVGIDDLVHVASRYWEARDDGEDAAQAIDTAFHHAGRAITGTTATTFIAFAVLAGVYFLQSKNLAILTAFGVLASYLLTLALAPRILAGRA